MASGEGNVVLLQDNDIAPAELNIQHGEGTEFPPEGIPHIEQVNDNNDQDIQFEAMEMMELPQSRSKAMLILLGKSCCWRVLAIMIWTLIFILLTLYVIMWFSTTMASNYEASGITHVIWFTPYLVLPYIMTVAIIIAGIKTYNPIPVIFGAVWVFSFFVMFLFLMWYAGFYMWPITAVWLFIFIIHYGYARKLRLALLQYKIRREGRDIEHLGGRMQDVMKDLMQRNGSYYIRGYALSFWGILMFLAVLAAVRCLLQRIGACQDESYGYYALSDECFEGRIYWRAPGYFEDSWGNVAELVGNIAIGSFIVHGIRNYKFGLSVFGSIWILINMFIMIWLGKRGYKTNYEDDTSFDDVRYYILAILCGFTFLSQILFTHKLKISLMEYKQKLRNRDGLLNQQLDGV